MRYLLLLTIVLAGCASEPKNCMHVHLPDGAIMTYCGKGVDCIRGKDNTGEMSICHTVQEQ